MTDYSAILTKLSYHAVYDQSIRAALEWAAENGFSGVQIAAEAPHFRVAALPDSECERVRSLLHEKGLRLTLHAHDENVSLFEAQPHLREGILKYYRELFAAARRLGASIVTIHLGALPTYPVADSTGTRQSDVDLLAWHKAFDENLKKLVGFAAGGPLLCVENVQLTADTRKLLQPCLDRKELALCWDIPKCYDRQLHSNTELEDYLRHNIAHVRQVHLHDIDAGGHSHRTIGEGKIDFLPYFESFVNAEILDYCIEVRPREQAKASLEALSKLLSAN